MRRHGQFQHSPRSPGLLAEELRLHENLIDDFGFTRWAQSAEA
jgi:hypothetical protein